ncbi:MAG: hypothetical protein ACM31L_11375 [Actinomycetota bacterium]
MIRIAALLACLAFPVLAQDQRPRQDLRVEQDRLHPSELREGERRLDAIRERGRTDPGTADAMRRIYEADHSLATINRPIPGGQPTPGLVGPGERVPP